MRRAPENGPRLADVELELVDESRNARRYYAIEVHRTLFARALVIRRGRIGGPLITVEEPFEDDRTLARRYDELVAKRRRHGYVPSRRRMPER
jgi:predicted DNA-binding WGR domain protein